MSEIEFEPIPKEILAEQYYGFMHRLIEAMQTAFRGSDIDQKELATRVGKAPSFVSRCLTGQQNMTVRTIHDLARGMNCRPDVVFVDLDTVVPSNRARVLRPYEYDEAETGTIPPQSIQEPESIAA